ncbi:antigen peptide transporter 2 [Neosynchiropus ocellatus]
MGEVWSCGFVLLLFDLLLGSALWSGLVLLQNSCCSGLTGVWVLSAVRGAALWFFLSTLTEGHTPLILRRLLLLLCLLSPVMESGQMLTSSFDEPYPGPSMNLSRLLLSSVSSVLACALWETVLCGQQKQQSLDSRRLLTRMLKFFREDTCLLLAAFTSLILAVVCEALIPLYQGNVIDILRGDELHSTFHFAIGKLSLAVIGSAVFSGLRGGAFMLSLARLNKRLKHLLFHSLLQQEMRFFEENKPGSLSSRLHSDVDRMGRTVALNANAMLRSSVKSCLMVVLMFTLSVKLTVLTCIEAPLLALMQNKYYIISKELKEQMQECQAHARDATLQTLSGIQTVRSFNAEKGEIKRYSATLDQIHAIKRRMGINSAVFLLVRRLVSLVLNILMLVQASSLILSGQLTIGSLVSFLLYQKPLSRSLRELMICFGDTMSTTGVISKVCSYLDRRPTWVKEGDLAPDQLEGGVRFQNVSFTYSVAAEDNPALKSVTFELKPGKMTALVGPSGSGKTSCVSLLTRMYDPQEGRIHLDGKPLHQYQHKYLHQKVAVVSQNPTLFSGSLLYNILYGLNHSSTERVKYTAKQIHADNILQQLEEEEDIERQGGDVGDCAGKLSDGQKQSVAIIRALVRDPKILILDEATSKLDVNAQHVVLKEVVSRGLTLLVVAHQLKTVEQADHIIFMEKGQVVEEGTHQQLMAKGGRYHRLKEELFN